MGALLDLVSVVRAYLHEMFHHGLPEFVQRGDREVIMLLDGVGGFQFIPLLVRKVLRDADAPISSTWFRWQTLIPGLMLVDLMWRSRNQRQAEILAEKLLALQRNHTAAKIHIIAYSGGTGVAVFALELLKGRVPIESLLLFAPALSPTYNLAPAMSGVQRAFVMTSRKDTWLLGAGTRIFGTMDRKPVRAAGMVGFVVPAGLSAEDQKAYARIRVVEWCEDFRRYGHSGGHTGWAQVPFLRHHLRNLLEGHSTLPTRSLDSPPQKENNLKVIPESEKGRRAEKGQTTSGPTRPKLRVGCHAQAQPYRAPACICDNMAALRLAMPPEDFAVSSH